MDHHLQLTRDEQAGIAALYDRVDHGPKPATHPCRKTTAAQSRALLSGMKARADLRYGRIDNSLQQTDRLLRTPLYQGTAWANHP
jgi:hypothetical protein